MVGFRKKKGSVGTALFSSFAWSAKLRPILERERERESLSGKMRHGDVRYNFTACRAEGIELAHDRLVRESCTRIFSTWLVRARVSWLPMSFGRGERLGQGGNCMGRHTIRVITQLLHIDI